MQAQFEAGAADVAGTDSRYLICSTLTVNTELRRDHPRWLGDRRRTARGTELLSDRQYIGNAVYPCRTSSRRPIRVRAISQCQQNASTQDGRHPNLPSPPNPTPRYQRPVRNYESFGRRQRHVGLKRCSMIPSWSLHRLAPFVGHPSVGWVKPGYHLPHCPNFRSPLYPQLAPCTWASPSPR